MNKPAKIKTSSISPDYDADGYGWAMAQGKLLRERRFDAIDWDNVAEEIETMGRSERGVYRSQLVRVLLHMFKWETQPERRSVSWWLSIVNGREEALQALKENPSLKPELSDIHKAALDKARRQAWAETGIPKSVFDAIEIPQSDAFDREIPRPESDD
ncbi:MAG: DUF29 domain-containing protein [Sphingomonadales bacterium]